MATWDPPLNLPLLIHHRRYARNGRLVQADLYRRTAEAVNHAVAYRRKCVAQFCQPISYLATRVSTSDVAGWRSHFHTGHGVSQIEVRLTLGLASTSATNPVVYCTLTPNGGSPDTSASLVCQESSSSAVGPDTWSSGVLTFDADDDTDYFLQLYYSDYARVIAMEAHEVAVVPVNDAVTGAVDPRCIAGDPIFDGKMAEIATNQSAMLLDNRRQLITWAAYDGVGDQSNNTTTYKNILDGTSTSVTAATPGWFVQNQYCNTYSVDSVPCVLAVHVTLGTGEHGYVKLTDGTNEIETAELTASGWKLTDGDLPAAAATKFDVWAKTTGLAGGSITVNAVSLLEYDHVGVR